jgi:hypothetical protein
MLFSNRVSPAPKALPRARRLAVLAGLVIGGASTKGPARCTLLDRAYVEEPGRNRAVLEKQHWRPLANHGPCDHGRKFLRELFSLLKGCEGGPLDVQGSRVQFGIAEIENLHDVDDLIGSATVVRRDGRGVTSHALTDVAKSRIGCCGASTSFGRMVIRFSIGRFQPRPRSQAVIIWRNVASGHALGATKKCPARRVPGGIIRAGHLGIEAVTQGGATAPNRLTQHG